MQTTTFGVMAPVYFLGTWLLASFEMSQEDHRQYRPAVKDIRSYLETYGDDVDS